MLTLEIIKPFAVVVGLLLSVAVILPAAFIWYRKQIFGYGGSVLVLSGLVLSGLSIWSNIEFSASPDKGVEVKLSELEQKVNQAEHSVNQAVASIRGLDQSVTSIQSDVSKSKGLDQKLASLEKQLNQVTASNAKLASSVTTLNSELALAQPSGGFSQSYTSLPTSYTGPTTLTPVVGTRKKLSDDHWRVEPKGGVATIELAVGNDGPRGAVIIDGGTANHIKSVDYLVQYGGKIWIVVGSCPVGGNTATCDLKGLTHVQFSIVTDNDSPLAVDVVGSA
jgi:hypothetical protein